MGRKARKRSRGGGEGGQGLDGGACSRDARLPGRGRADHRLWQQHPPGREGRGRRQCVRFSGLDRKSVVSGKSVSVRVDLGGRRLIKKQKNEKQIVQTAQ